MSRKRFCDGCDREMGDEPGYYGLGALVKRHDRGGKIKLCVRVDDEYQDWDICRYCVVDAFAALDDRPKAAPPSTSRAA